EVLVSGLVAPAYYEILIHRNEHVEIRLKIIEKKVDALSDEYIVELAKLAKQVEKNYNNQPLDLEWGFTNGTDPAWTSPSSDCWRSSIRNAGLSEPRSTSTLPCKSDRRLLMSLGNTTNLAIPDLFLLKKFPSQNPSFYQTPLQSLEVGGMLQHGAVVSREYGLPAVVVVANAKKLFHNGHLIHASGSIGHIQMLSD
ncbi:unnamed protein product, partial [Rotaria magnacalcarata]